MKYFLKFLFIFAFFTEFGFSQTNFFDYENRLKFAKNLFKEKDYIRSLDEFIELSKISSNDSLKLWSAISLRKMERFTESEIYLRTLFGFSNLEDEAKTEFFRLKFLTEKADEFQKNYENEELHPEKYRLELLRLKYFSHLFLDGKLPDSTKFINSFKKENQPAIAKFYNERKYRIEKNSQKAAIFSAILPGLGKIYTENYSDAITSFLFTSIFYGLSAYNFSNDSVWKGVIFAGIGAYFHASSIYGSAVAAQHFNAQQKFEYELRLKKYAETNNAFLPNFDPK